MLDVWLPSFECPASVVASESDSGIVPFTTETGLSPSNGVSSWGAVGMATVMIIGGSYKREGGRWKRKEEEGRKERCGVFYHLFIENCLSMQHWLALLDATLVGDADATLAGG